MDKKSTKSSADLPSGLLLEWQRKLKFKRQEMTIKMKKKKLSDELALLEGQISALLSKRTALKEAISAADDEILECQRAQADPPGTSASAAAAANMKTTTREKRSSLPSQSASAPQTSQRERAATTQVPSSSFALKSKDENPGPLPPLPPSEASDEEDNANASSGGSSAKISASSQRTSGRRGSIAAPAFKVDQNDKRIFDNIKTRMRQYSSKSVRAVSTLEDINSQMNVVEGTIDELIAQANAEGAGKDVLVRVKNSLALLHGKAETLLYKHVDTVITGELKSGKADARALRKSLVRRANNIIESVDKLFGFVNLHVSRIASESSNGEDSESEDDGDAASDFEDAHDSDFEDAEDDDVEILYTMDMDETTARQRRMPCLRRDRRKSRGLSPNLRALSWKRTKLRKRT